MMAHSVFTLMLVSACGSGGGQREAVATAPQSDNAAAECAAAAHAITGVLAADTESKTKQAAVRPDVEKRCREDRWTPAARSCLREAQTSEAVKACGDKQLTQQQRDHLDTSTVALTRTWNRLKMALVELTNRICACNDQACAQQVSDDMTQVLERLGGTEVKRSKDEQMEFDHINLAMAHCYHAAVAAGTPPQLTSVEPKTASAGVELTLVGTNLANRVIDHVYFGNHEGVVVGIDSNTELVVEAPNGKPGETVDIRVVFEPGGEVVLRNAFTFANTKAPPKPKKK
jgi:hypothetical protein